jgi:predicted RNA-binding protein with PIN domain
MSARFLVVDGHSVIFSWPDLRALHDRNRSAARHELIERLGRLHDTTHWLVTLVLDGKLGAAATPRAKKNAGMVVCYAHADQTADSIIERLVAASGAAADVLVVTADEAEKLMVESLGAMTHSPAWLREELTRSGEIFSAELNRVHRSAHWNKLL